MMAQLLQFLFSGLTVGATYALATALNLLLVFADLWLPMPRASGPKA